MAYKVVRSEEADHDFELIFDHLFMSYMTFDEPLQDAFARAIKRIAAIETDMETLLLAPFQGTLDRNLRPNLRYVAKNQSVFYFEVDEEELSIRILAIFLSGQDHQRHMLKRLGDA
ncbi:type II toxin-antitoxin system RelE/ParE family toxin [Rhizobium deserti]|uniref:Type II toxin-antitoxin system RelE/ParE family toxin n=1 Tax=Rhizobium deserti TaxID=2547961 RepID=A0A4R5UI57_9HYPH|nr:type II toxin-antitoxin system RelE/ParE family toxin [Rhizobium deserti]TDK35663.1 type II toxin-antitoxin system RelE/ParE family toxin [Rhizobium deserti]